LNNLAIYGAGGFGRETALLVNQINANRQSWKLTGFYDDGLPPGKTVDNLSILGGIDALNSVQVPTNIVIAIADPISRQRAYSKITNSNIIFPTIIHPSFERGSPDNKVGKGCILTAGVILTTGIRLGDFVIINLLSSVGHDVSIGDFSSIMPGSNISGNVQIGPCTLIGTGTQVLQNLTIGSNCRVGAGSVVTHNFSDGVTVVGVPARIKH
jgi:sugar O-acyltransferase (sialic acid O-acetyltransferase NeuD family)